MDDGTRLSMAAAVMDIPEEKSPVYVPIYLLRQEEDTSRTLALSMDTSDGRSTSREMDSHRQDMRNLIRRIGEEAERMKAERIEKEKFIENRNGANRKRRREEE